MVQGYVQYQEGLTPDHLLHMGDIASWKEFHTINFKWDQLTTGAAVEVGMKNGVTITNIGIVPVTLVGAFSADDNYYDDSYVYITYIDSMAVSHYAYMATNTTSTTEVAFTEIGTGTGAVTDCYAITSITIFTDVSGAVALPTQAGETFGCGATGALTMGVVAAAASVAVEGAMLGIGTVYGRYSADDTDYDNAKAYMCYITYAGEEKYAICTMDGADPTNEIVFYEATSNGDDDYYTTTVTSDARPVRDFYRLCWLNVSVDPKADANENFLLTDANCANVNGVGADVYAMIEEAYSSSIHSRFHAPRQCRCILMSLKADAVGTSTNFYYLDLVYTPKGYIKEITERFTLYLDKSLPELDIEFQPGTDFYLNIIDAAAPLTVNITYQIIMAEKQGAQYPAL